MAPRRRTPALYIRSMAPSHSSKVGIDGVFNKHGNGIALLLRQRCKVVGNLLHGEGLADVRAPSHNTSMHDSIASRVWRSLATSVAVSMPVASLAFASHSRGGSADALESAGSLVRGFHTPARNMRTPARLSARAVSKTCCSLSALQGKPSRAVLCSIIPAGKEEVCRSFFRWLCL